MELKQHKKARKAAEIKNLNLVLCGLENVNLNGRGDTFVIFGDWVSEQKYKNNLKDTKLFPFDFDVSEIQTRAEILTQDKQVQKLYLKLLKTLSQSLNSAHNESFSVKQWEIIIGYWLRHYLDALMVRWILCKKVLQLKVNNIFLFETFNENIFPLPATRDDFARFCNSSQRWNQLIISRITENIIDQSCSDLYPPKVYIQPGPLKFSNGFKQEMVFTRWIHRAKNFSKSIIESLCRLLPASILVYSPNLTIYQIILLAFKLKRIPFIYFLRDSSKVSGVYSSSSDVHRGNSIGMASQENISSNLLRTKLQKMLVSKDSFSKLVSELLPVSLPRCYLEDWSKYRQSLKCLNLPKNIEKIYVGSGIITDEILRLFVAEKISDGCEFIISQHGGVYGFSLIQEKTEFVETRIADKWISWGWKSSKLTNVVAGPALKGMIDLNLPSKRDSIFVALPPVRFSPSRMNYSDPYEIVQGHIDFLQSLDKDIKRNVLIRPAPNHRNFEYIKKFEEHFVVSKSGTFEDDLRKSKLFLCTHNATTMLEALYSNFPTIILLPKNKYYTQHYLRDEAIPIINKMKKVGIYFDNTCDAKEKINSIWNDIDNWWGDEAIQSTVSEFCDIYCAKVPEPLESLANIIGIK